MREADAGIGGLRIRELLLALKLKDHDMKIMLTQNALKEIRQFGEYMSRMVVCPVVSFVNTLDNTQPIDGISSSSRSLKKRVLRSFEVKTNQASLPRSLFWIVIV